MNRFIKGVAIIFSILFFITAVENIINNPWPDCLILIFINLLLNSLYCLFFISLTNILYKNFGKGAVFISLILMIFFIVWTLIGELTRLISRLFFSIQFFFFFWAMTIPPLKILLVISAAIVALLASWLIYRFTLLKAESFKIDKLWNLVVILILLLIIFSAVPEKYQKTLSQVSSTFFHVTHDIDAIIVHNISTNETHERIIYNLNLTNPNIVIVMLESVSSNHVGYNGYGRNVTSNIDWFAERSVVFNNAYSLASHSDYAQTGFLSSMYPLKDNIRDDFETDYPREFIWDVLKKYNYSTAYITSQDDNWMNIKQYYNKTNLDLYTDSLDDEQYDYGFGYGKKDYDNNTLEKALNWINATSNKFFLYVNFQATHHPYEYPPEEKVFLPDETSILSTFNEITFWDLNGTINRYDNALMYVDKQVGKLKQYLIDTNKLNNTLIILTADHGEDLTYLHNFPRHGIELYENEMKIPLMFFIPGNAAYNISERVTHLDVIPTVLKNLNFSVPEIFQGKEIRTSIPIYLMSQTHGLFIGLIKDNIKYIYNTKELEGEAYNLTIDPNETTNLVLTKNSEYLKKYENQLLKWYNCQIMYYRNYSSSSKIINC